VTNHEPPQAAIRDVYDLLTGDEDARICKDIPDVSCREQPRNFLLHMLSLSATKTGDWFASPKLTLSWLLTHIGAPAWMVGLLVPLRESLSLLPQLFVARAMRGVPRRKWFWVAGSVVQGLAVGGMALAVAMLDGVTGGGAVLALLGVFSLARGACSVASKDVLGKTIARTRRGRVNGYAESAAGAVIVATGVAGLAPDNDGNAAVFVILLLAAAALWLLAAFTYSFVAEYAGATKGGGNAIREALDQLQLMRSDRGLRRFVIVRSLLLSTALVAPYYVTLTNQRTSGALSGLGALMIAAGAASFLSAPVWGRYADRSSRGVMATAALLAAIAGGMTILVALVAGDALAAVALPASYFLLCVAHNGVRLGRKTHLVDIASGDNRASYVAVSNTVIGVMLLAGSGFAAIAALFGTVVTIAVLSCIALLSSHEAMQLENAQADQA